MQIYVDPGSQSKVAGPYLRKLLEELDDIVEQIPAEQLAVQWDTAVEFAVLEGLMPTWFEDAEDGIVAMLAALGYRVPAEVEMGYHFCYGDAGHKHFVEPTECGFGRCPAETVPDLMKIQAEVAEAP